MTYAEATDFSTMLLKGDNSSAVVTPFHFRMALMEIATLCEPAEMIADYTGIETDVFRILHSEEEVIDFETITIRKYIKAPLVPTPIVDDDELPIDRQLDLAVVYFICSYLSNSEKDRYETKASRTINTYVSNEIE